MFVGLKISTSPISPIEMFVFLNFTLKKKKKEKEKTVHNWYLERLGP